MLMGMHNLLIGKVDTLFDGPGKPASQKVDLGFNDVL